MGRIIRSGWTPAAICAITCCWIVAAFGVGAAEIFRYAIWLVYCVTLPGTLVYRSLRGTPRSFVEDVAAGAAVGYSLQMLLYIAWRAAGVPMMVVVWPGLVIGAFAITPRLRRHFRSHAPERVPVGWAWAIAACILLSAGWLAGVFFHTHPLVGAVAGRPYVDFPYHLAIAGEVKHHVPPTWPYVLGERLYHHWFSHAEAAASSWATGLELRLILLRLQLFPHLAAGIVLTALLGSRLARRWWPGVVAVIVAYFVSSFSPFGWSPGGIFNDFKLLDHFQWQAPTQIVATTVFGPVPILLIDRFRKAPGTAGHWILVTLLLAATMGAKSSVLPVYLVGLGVAGLVELVRRRRIQTAALIGGLIGSGLFLLSFYVLYGGMSYGLRWEVLGYARRLPVVRQIGLTPSVVGAGTLTIVGVLAAASWMMRGATAIGYAAGRSGEIDRSPSFLMGSMIGAVPLVLFSTHPGGSNVNFIRSAYPMFGAVAAGGLSRLVPRSRDTASTLSALCVAAGTGGVGAWLLARRHTVAPSVAQAGSSHALLAVAQPFLVVIAAGLACVVGARLLARRVSWLRGIAAALTLAAVAGAGFPNTIPLLRKALHPDSAEWFTLQTGVRSIPDGALVAARWLRDHSSTDDVVATNTHCRFISAANQCDNRHFWISAYTERRVLVEGWGYTAYSMRPGGGFYYDPFPDQRRLGDNDAAFSNPSTQTIATLRSYGVRWLFVDERYDTPAAALDMFATLAFRSGDCAVYRI